MSIPSPAFVRYRLQWLLLGLGLLLLLLARATELASLSNSIMGTPCCIALTWLFLGLDHPLEEFPQYRGA
jgi:hypothetical protein